MARPQNEYTGDGSSVLFSFTFPYLDQIDVKASIDGTPTTEFTFDNATTLRFTNPPANGSKIVIYRRTDVDALKVEFYPGSSIRAQDLNEDFTQTLFVTQEVVLSSNTAAAAADAAAASAAQSAASSAAAQTSANQAIADAAAASALATSAKNTADSAISTAVDATLDAADAVTVANTASADAAAALAAVASALPSVTVPDVASIPSSPKDKDVVEVLNSTGIESFQPLTGLHPGFIGDSGKRVKIIYSDSPVGSWVFLSYTPNDPDARYEVKDPNILRTSAIGVSVQAYDTSILKSANIGSTVQGYDPTILKSADIGSAVQAYDPTILKSTNIGATVQGYDADTAKLDVAQTWTAAQTFNGTSVFNEDGGDVDLRVEGDTATHLLFADASTDRIGINQPGPAARLDLAGNYCSNAVAVPALDINCSTSNYFTKTISVDSTFTFSNAPAGRVFTFMLSVNHTGGTITWPTTVRWPSSTAPTLTVGKNHLFMFVTDDGGALWKGTSLTNYTV